MKGIVTLMGFVSSCAWESRRLLHLPLAPDSFDVRRERLRSRHLPLLRRRLWRELLLAAHEVGRDGDILLGRVELVHAVSFR